MPGPQDSSNAILDFGGLAIMTDFSALDPWLCVAGFHRLCLFVSCTITAYHFLNRMTHTLQNCLHTNVDVDLSQMMQALRKLVVNACQAMSKGREFIISSQA